ERALAGSGNVTLAVQNRVGDQQGKADAGMPLARFARHARLASISVSYNWQNSAWAVPYAAKVDGHLLPSLAAATAGVSGPVNQDFRIDYALDAESAPSFSAAAFLEGRVPRSAIAGKTVLVGTNSTRINDQYLIPGRGKRGGVFIHLLAAETLKKGTPVDLGWIPALLAALAIAVLAVRAQRPALLGIAALGILILPLASEAV